MSRFSYDHEILEGFPNVVGGIIHADGVRNRPAPAELTAAFLAEQRAVIERIGQTPLSELPTLTAWRGVFRGFGVDPTKYRSAAEALLRRLTKQGELPSINTLVDLANLVSIRYALPVAVFDQRAVHGGTIVRLAHGGEHWEDLGASQTQRPEPGEVDLRRRRGAGQRSPLVLAPIADECRPRGNDRDPCHHRGSPCRRR